MATKRKSGFDAPVIGQVMPKGTKYKKGPDGKLIIVKPKKKKK